MGPEPIAINGVVTPCKWPSKLCFCGYFTSKSGVKNNPTEIHSGKLT